MDIKKITIFMLDWAESYYKSRDAFTKSIISIEKKPDSLLITFKDKKEEVIIAPNLSEVTDSRIQNNCSYITLNNKPNVDALFSSWKKWCVIPLKVYFINPFSTLDKKWIINPQVHSKISEEAALQLGLNAMYETVEPITLEQLESKL